MPRGVIPWQRCAGSPFQPAVQNASKPSLISRAERLQASLSWALDLEACAAPTHTQKTSEDPMACCVAAKARSLATITKAPSRHALHPSHCFCLACRQSCSAPDGRAVVDASFVEVRGLTHTKKPKARIRQTPWPPLGAAQASEGVPILGDTWVALGREESIETLVAQGRGAFLREASRSSHARQG